MLQKEDAKCYGDFFCTSDEMVIIFSLIFSFMYVCLHRREPKVRY